MSVIDLIALWLGRALLVSSGGALAAYLIGLCTKFIMWQIKGHHNFLQWLLDRDRFEAWKEAETVRRREAEERYES